VSIKQLRDIPTLSPAYGGAKYRWGIKIFSQTIQDSAIETMEGE